MSAMFKKMPESHPMVSLYQVNLNLLSSFSATGSARRFAHLGSCPSMGR